MKEKTKKILVWSSASILIVGLLFIGFVFSFIYCYERGEIKQYSLCYFCVSKTIRNFPLTDVAGEPLYSRSAEYRDVYVKQAYSNVRFATYKTPDEIIGAAEKYFNSIGFETKEIGCFNAPEYMRLKYPRCSADFAGKDSEISMIVDLKTGIGGTRAETNYVTVTEEFKVSEENQ